MRSYEYQEIVCDDINDGGRVEDSLNPLGAEGWRAVQMWKGTWGHPHFLLEREIPQEMSPAFKDVIDAIGNRREAELDQ